MYQSRTCDFKAELTADEREALCFGAIIFYRSNVESVILRNVHVAWMTLINS